MTKNVLEKFCYQIIRQHIIVQGGGEEQQYGTPDEVSSEKEEMLSFAQEIQFSDRAETYMLNIIAQISSSHELISALLKLLPFLLIIIFLVSFSGAWICSRLIVKPVIEISEVSKRMEKLDMTWQCKINRTDEIGILANSLNSMSQNLSDTMLKLETANRQLKQDMEHIDELNKQRQYFFATASHELKTPISAILMSLKLLEDKRIGDMNDEQIALAGSIRESSDRLLEITGELLKMTQVEAGKLQLNPKITKPIELIDYAIKANRVQAERFNCHIEVEYPEKISKLFVDSEKIAWVLTNLLSNAIHYTPENGRIVIGAHQVDKKVEIFVQDFGKGIDPRYHQSIFSIRYFRVPARKYREAASVLPSVRLCRAHGGTIRVDSEVGKGSTFVITFDV